MRYSKSQIEFERKSILTVSSVYGIDILEDNVKECRKRLFEIFDKKYIARFKKKVNQRCRDAVIFILERNIIIGNALTLYTVGIDPKPIVFSEWSFPYNDSRIKRRDFTFSDFNTKR